MNISRRRLLKVALGIPPVAWLLNYRAIAAPSTGQVKITKIKTMGLDNLGDGCLVTVQPLGFSEAGKVALRFSTKQYVEPDGEARKPA